MRDKLFFVLLLGVTSILVTSMISTTPSDVFGYSYEYSFVGVTSNGVEFPILSPVIPSGNSTGTGDGDSVFDGLGVYLTIQNIGSNGVVYFGSGDDPGEQTDIRQYVEVGNNDDWVVAITDDDYTEVLAVPEFGVGYEYISGSLINVTNNTPNILGYSTSKSMSGTNSISINNDGITISGTGIVVADITMMDGTSVLLTGIIDAGANLEIIQTIQDVIGVISFDGTKGYLISEMTAILSGSNAYVNTNIHVHTSDVLVVETWQTSIHLHSELVRCGRGSCYVYTNHPHIDNMGAPTITSIIDGDGNRLITRIEKSGIAPENTFEFKLYVSDFGEKLQVFNSDFEALHTFETSTKNIYLIAEIDNSSVSIKGETFDPLADIFFQVDGLPADIAYDISKSGITGVVGKTSNTGIISLLAENVDFGIGTSPGGILSIYPNSTKYIGNLGIGMIDVLHKVSTELPIGDDLAYIPQNYVYWVFPVPVEIENLRVDNTPLNYLNRNYTLHEALYIPVIPSANTIYATINGQDVEILMRDVATTTQTKQVPKESSVSSDHTTEGPASTSSNISTSTYLTATHTGMMYVNLDFKVGGAADFSMDATYAGGFTESTSCNWHGASSPSRTHSCRTFSTPSNPNSITNMVSLTADHQTEITAALHNGQLSNLTVEVDILRNMTSEEDSILIYTSNSAEAYITSTFSEAGYNASNQVYITYPLTSISENIAIPVTVGDMMEFVIRVNLEVSGAPAPSSADARYSSYVQATTEFGGGIISVGMS